MRISNDFIKNDVPAFGQVKDDSCASFRFAKNAKMKILFLDNSIIEESI